MTDTKPHSKDDVLRMADRLDELCGKNVIENSTLHEAAAMLRAYAEVVEVEVDDAVVERAHNAYWDYTHDDPSDQHKIDRDSMRAALTAALSTRSR